MEPQEGVVLAGRFTLERRLGRGGMGDVWSATNGLTGRRVAIKLLHGEDAADPTVKKRFLREARAASRVQHPNVVEILDVLEIDDGAPAMVMELLDGESLGQRLRRVRTLPLRELASLLVPAIAAVGAAHAAGVVHRDLKPDNIFIARGHDGATVVKVLDFGIAKIAGDGEAGQTNGLTGTGAMLGTPYYMAPEQLFTDETLDYRCDVWALGVILYECLAGKRPARGDNFADVVKVIATRAITPLEKVAPDVPPEILELVGRMLSFEKEARPQNLREVCDVLRHHTDVLASSFGDPVLKPIKQGGSDPEASGGLRKADVDLLLAADDAAATEPDLPARLRVPPTIQMSGDVSGAPDTHGRLGLGITLAGRARVKPEEGVASPGKRPARWLVPAAGLAAVAAILLGVQVLSRTKVPDAAARGNVTPPVAVEVPPRATAQPVTAPVDVPTDRTATGAALEPARPAASEAVKAPVVSGVPAARPKPAPPAPPATAPATAAPTTAPGGLVEKPPF